MDTKAPLPTFFIPHGGGPCFFMEWPGEMAHAWDPLAAFLRGIAGSIERKPSAILVVSGHWEEAKPTVTTATTPTLIYDYSGFPAHTYELRYDAPGSPAVAARVRELLEGAGIASGADDRRGFDHGVFVPFLLIDPEAGIPVVQLSLAADLDAEKHLAIGRALAPLRDEGVLIVGSGMSYHNMREFMSRGESDGSERFDEWLTGAVQAQPAERDELLAHWQQRAPEARRAHPREDHLIPLMVAAGAAGNDLGTRVFHDRISGSDISGYRFG